MSMNTLTEEPEDMETMDETARLLRSVSETDTEGLRDHKGEAWTEDVWGGTVLQKEAMQHSNEKLERRVNDFLAQATENDKAEFEQSRKDMLQKIGEVVNARSAKEQDPRTRFQHICRSIKDAGNKTSEVALGYMHMLDVMVGQAPEYVALAYGAIKIILIVQINYAETKQKVAFYLQQFAEKFRMIDHLTTLRPTKSLLEKISRAYAGYMRFLGKAVKLYKEGRFKNLLKNFVDPWKSRMQPIVDSIEQTFQDIKETAQYHGLVSTHINTDLGERILSIVTEMFDEVRTVRFNKKDDIEQAAANIRQRLDENLDNPTKEEFPDGMARAEPSAGDFYSQTVPNSLAQDLDELFPALRAAREESERRTRAIEEHPDMREHRAAKRNLLRSEKFLSWLDSETSTLLWLDGNRLLSRLQLNSLFTSPLLLFGESNFGSIVVLRHSCAESASAEKYLTLVQSLVAQFLEQYPEIYQRKRGILVKERTTSMNSLWEVFVELLESVNAACFFIIIDSIDNVGSEDSLDSKEHDTLLELLKQLLADKGKLVKVLLTSSLVKQADTADDGRFALVRSQNWLNPQRAASFDGLRPDFALVPRRMTEFQEKSRKRATFFELMMLYTPETTIFNRDGDNLEAFVVSEISGMDQRSPGSFNPLAIRVWSVSHNGRYFSKRFQTFSISQYSGERRISGLKYVPSGYLPNEAMERTSLVERGRTYWKLGQGVHHQQVSRGTDTKRVMVDFAAAPTTHDADLVEQLPRSSTENLKPRILMLCPPQLPVYMLNDLEWTNVPVNSLGEVEFEVEPFRNVLVPEEHLELLRSLVKPAGLSNEIRSNLLLLFFGLPGVGKSLTAKCLSEETKLPLLIMKGGTLGDPSGSAKQTLTENFSFAEKWKCIIFIDDADPVLSKTKQRLSTDYVKGAAQKLFENHGGTVILSTTSVDHYDPALLALIHIKIYFPQPNATQSRQILRIYLEKIKDEACRKGEKISIDVYGIRSWAASKPMYGKDMKRHCKTALALARAGSARNGANIKLLAQHFEAIEHIAGSFEYYREKLFGYDSAIEEDSGDRARHDAFSLARLLQTESDL